MKEIREVIGDGRWITHLIYRLRTDGDVMLESWREDSDWSGYSSSREDERIQVLKIHECPKHIQNQISRENGR
jgi:hypothetical protein